MDSAADTQSKRPGPSLKARALALLSRREHSRHELARKLKPYAHAQQNPQAHVQTDTQPHEALEPLLDELTREGWLSDERYAQSLIHRQAQRLGTRRIVRTLREQGVDAEHTHALVAQLHDTEEARARAVWQKKFGKPPSDAKDHARQWRFMAYRGFSPDVLRRVIVDARHEY